MIQPISPKVNLNYKNQVKPSVEVVPMRDYMLNRDVEIINYLQEAKKQNEARNKLILSGIGMLGMGSVLISAAVFLKGGHISSPKGYTTGLAKGFESLAKDQKIPTLETCKSINKKLKKFLQEQVNYANASKSDIEIAGMPKPARMLLMYGPPGTGKTFFSKIFAKTLDAEYAEVKFADFNSRWCGQHIENLKGVMNNILDSAIASPKKKFVVTFNEIDAILQPAERMTQINGGNYGMVKAEERATILTYIDEILEKAPNVTIIGTTNLLPKNNQLDGAAMSRFNRLIEVSHPDKECLYEALKANLEKMVNGKDFIVKNKSKMEKFAEVMANRKSSFRDLDNIINTSKNTYLDEYMNNKNAEFKFKYLDDALNNLDLTDGERIATTKLNTCA